MVNLALWLKQRRFRLDQVQNFYPSPLANSTTMYYTGKNPLSKIGYKSEDVVVPKGDKQRRLHKALLRYHDPANWPLIRQALEEMGKKAPDRLAPRLSGASANAGRDARSAPPESPHAPGANQAHADRASAFERRGGREEKREAKERLTL